jgi:hypothetical protein
MYYLVPVIVVCALTFLLLRALDSSIEPIRFPSEGERARHLSG